MAKYKIQTIYNKGFITIQDDIVILTDSVYEKGKGKTFKQFKKWLVSKFEGYELEEL